MKLGKAVVKSRFVILILAVALMIPSALGMAFTRVNYDILSYLPDNLDTIKGQDYLLDDFGKGAFSFLIFENMDDKDVAATEEKSKKSTMLIRFFGMTILPTSQFQRKCCPTKFMMRSIREMQR